MSRTIDQLAETGSSAPDDYLIKRNTATGADQRISVENFSNFPAMPQVNGAPIVESGSNSDGEWTRWADGTQLSHKYESLSIAVDGGPLNGVHYVEVDWQFPSPFIEPPSSTLGARMAGKIMHTSLSGNAMANTTDRFFITCHSALSAQTAHLKFGAFGRWK